jgi:pantetheine-phosphate adenylyltransferase
MSARHLPVEGELVALYPGTFDPVHNGHLDLVERAAALFDRVIVAVYETPAKNLFFTTDERVSLMREAVAGWQNVEVTSYRTLTVEFAAARGARAVIRGLRATADFDFEFQWALMNRHLNPHVEALYLMTSQEHAHISSTLVKEAALLGANVSDLVPNNVLALLDERRRGR